MSLAPAAEGILCACAGVDSSTVNPQQASRSHYRLISILTLRSIGWSMTVVTASSAAAAAAAVRPPSSAWLMAADGRQDKSCWGTAGYLRWGHESVFHHRQTESFALLRKRNKTWSLDTMWWDSDTLCFLWTQRNFSALQTWLLSLKTVNTQLAVHLKSPGFHLNLRLRLKIEKNIVLLDCWG